MSIQEKIFEGKYNYFNQGQKYTEEFFTISKENTNQGHVFFNAEILSRVRTGEFLKIYVEYEIDSRYDPVQVVIKRQLGPKKSVESFDFNGKTKSISYSFDTENQKNVFEKVITSLPHVGTPAISTSMLMVNQKKIDPVQRTPYVILSSENIWEYQSGFSEQSLFIELQELDPQEIDIEGNKLKAMFCKLLQVDAKGAIQDLEHKIYLSKHYYVPYLASFGNEIEVKIEYLKQLNQHTKI